MWVKFAAKPVLASKAQGNLRSFAMILAGRLCQDKAAIAFPAQQGNYRENVRNSLTKSYLCLAKASISADFHFKFPTLVNREYKMPNREIFIGNRDF